MGKTANIMSSRPSGLVKPRVIAPKPVSVPVQPSPRPRPARPTRPPVRSPPSHPTPSLPTQRARPGAGAARAPLRTQSQRSPPRAPPAAPAPPPPPPPPPAPPALNFEAIFSQYQSQITTLTEQLVSQQSELAAKTVACSVAEAEAAARQTTLNALKEALERETADLAATRESLRAAMTETTLARADATAAAAAAATARADADRLSAELQRATSDAAALRERLAAADLSRRRLHNDLMDARGRVRAYARIREGAAGAGAEGEDGARVEVERAGGMGGVRTDSRLFVLDRVFGAEVGQSGVFDEISQLVTSCLDGYDVTVFAYGQTGAGKTYTMVGPVTAPGIVPRTAHQIFNHASSAGVSLSVQASVFELYNNTLRDLLSSNPLKLTEGAGTPTVIGLSTHTIDTPGDLVDLMHRAMTHRATAATDANATSSRSHTVFRLAVTVSADVAGGVETRRSVLNLVDLAGSERWATAHPDLPPDAPASEQAAHAARVEEMKYINQSLSALGRVMSQLAAGETHINYRDSLLTRVLQPSLTGDGKCCLLACVGGDNARESVNTLVFASGVKSIEPGKRKPRKQISFTSK